MDSPLIIEAKQLNQPESMTNVMNSFVKETLEYLWVESCSIAECAFMGSKNWCSIIGMLTQSFKDANQNYIICPIHDMVANITSITNTNKDRSVALVYLVLWSCISQDSFDILKGLFS
jgi:hypothetical protein